MVIYWRNFMKNCMWMCHKLLPEMSVFGD